MRHLVILVTVIGAAQLMTSAYLIRKDAQEAELSKKEKTELLRLLKRKFEADESLFNQEAGISFKRAPEEEPEMTKREHPTDILMDEQKINAEDNSPAVRLSKKNDEADDSQSNPEAGISFQRVPEKEEKPDVTKRENPSDILKNEQKIEAEEDSPALESLERRQVLSGDAAAFLKAHNDKRRIVNPTATNMKEMTWSTELETIARNYAKNCNFKHNDYRSSTTSYYVGENLYVSYGDITPEQAVTSWDDEKNDYTFSNNWCDPNSKFGCGHYTQVVWADSETVGCVKHFCSNSITNFGYRGYLVVCNYGPGGNINSRRPYTSGTTCKDCPAGYTCVNKLCSKSSGGGGSNPCSTNPCKNGGTCTSVSGNAVCKCTNGWSGSTCETNDAFNPCSPNPCQNGGSCTNNNGNAQCQCGAGWTGSTCTTQDASNPCSPNPCQNGGSCTNNNGNAQCQCSTGWSGSTCTTQANTKICNFESSMCLTNFKDDDADFMRFSSFTMNGVKVKASEGNAFACAYAGYEIGQKYAYLISNYLEEVAVEVQFRYRVIGSASLSFVYQQGEKYNTMFSYKNDNGLWQSWSVTIPPGKETFFYFKATLESYSMVGIDDVQIKNRI